MQEPDKTYIHIVLDPFEAALLAMGKEKSGIRGTADFVRHLITVYVAGEKQCP